MTEKIKHKNVYEAILAVMQESEYVQKERKGQLNYSVKSEEAVLKELRPYIVKHGLVILPVEIKDIHHSQIEKTNSRGNVSIWKGTKATHVFRFVHAESETLVDVSVFGEGEDVGDKSCNKSMTVAKKYALLSSFLMITGDDPDYTSSEEMENTKQQTQPDPETRKAKLNPEGLKRAIEATLAICSDAKLQNGDRIVASTIESFLADFGTPDMVKAWRKGILKYLFGLPTGSTKEMSNKQIQAVFK